MNWDDIWIGIVITAIVTLLLIILAFAVFAPISFEGYYLSNGVIWAAYRFEPDEKACDFSPERWQQILDNKLHLEKK